jgi:hypothetical protein
MSPAGDIVDLLQARASSGRAAFEIARQTLAKIIAALQRNSRFATATRFELELVLMNEYRELEEILFNEMRNRIHLDDAEDAVRCVLPGD